MKFNIKDGVITGVTIDDGDVEQDILKVELPHEASIIGSDAFKGVRLPSILWIKEGATEIAPLAFIGHKELRSVSFPTTMRKSGIKHSKIVRG